MRPFNFCKECRDIVPVTYVPDVDAWECDKNHVTTALDICIVRDASDPLGGGYAVRAHDAVRLDRRLRGWRGLGVR